MTWNGKVMTEEDLERYYYMVNIPVLIPPKEVKKMCDTITDLNEQVNGLKKPVDVKLKAENLLREITEYLWCTNGLPHEFPEHMEDGLLKILIKGLES